MSLTLLPAGPDPQPNPIPSIVSANFDENADSTAGDKQGSQEQQNGEQQEQQAEALNLPVSLAAYASQAKDYARQAKSKNTRRAYASDWDDFARWC